MSFLDNLSSAYRRRFVSLTGSTDASYGHASMDLVCSARRSTAHVL